jgi:hypothetical protein
MRSDFGVFILSHGRPDNVITYKTLIKSGYTGKIYIIVDDEDKDIENYKKVYNDKLIVFNKSYYYNNIDNGDNFENYRSTTHVRNAIFDKSKELGLKYFVMLDDDYNGFQIRFNNKFEYEANVINKSLDKYFEAIINYLANTPIIKSICLSQGGDWFGGGNGAFGEKLMMKRKAMNSFFCDVDRPFKFISRLNEDVNTYMTLGNKGDVFFTINHLMLNQLPTQSNKGGMTDAYLEGGTYIKSFYTVMYGPSYTKVCIMGSKNKRLHHRIKWENAVPMILNEKYKK